MKILNVHRRQINANKEELTSLLETLASKSDKIWPHEHWPRMKLDQGLQAGSKGGHGPIRYIVQEHIPGLKTCFKFIRPKGFQGYHYFEMNALNDTDTELIHTIDMNTSGLGTLQWLLVIRCLHDALIEDAFDKIENVIDQGQRRTKWSWWVKFCRKILKA